MKQENWQKVRSILVDIVRQKPEDRQARLERASDHNKENFREVESLLSSFDSAESFMESAAVIEVAESFNNGIPQLECGQTFGHYEIVKQIGKGGMGEVHPDLIEIECYETMP